MIAENRRRPSRGAQSFSHLRFITSHSARLRHRTGVSIVYIAVLLTFVMFGIVSFAVDVGRIRVAKGQLQTSADAAAMAAALNLPLISLPAPGNANNVFDFDDIDDIAVGIAADNIITVDNQPVVLQPVNDIEYGVFNPTTRTFTVTARGNNLPGDPRQNANAVRVTAHRLASRGTALGMTFARIVGKNTQDLNAVAIAYVANRVPPGHFGIVGLNSVGSNGNPGVIDSYRPQDGPYSAATARRNAHTASNGNISLGNGDVYGDCRPGVGKTLSQGPNSVVTGWKAPLDQPLVYPAPTVPGGAQTLPLSGTIGTGGTIASPVVYTTSSASLPRANKLTIAGAVKIYMTASTVNQDLSDYNPPNKDPRYFRLYISGSGNVSLNGNGKAYVEMYAPGVDVGMNGNTGWWGSIIAKSIDHKGGSGIHYDENDGGPIDGSQYKVILVK